MLSECLMLDEHEAFWYALVMMITNESNTDPIPDDKVNMSRVRELIDAAFDSVKKIERNQDG